MKNISIATFVNTIFIISFIAILTTFWLFISWDKERYIIYERQRYTVMADAFLSGLQFSPTPKQLEELYRYFDVALVHKSEDKLDIVNHAKLLYVKESTFGRVRIFASNKAKYIYAQNYGYNLMLKDLKPKKYNQEIALFLLGLILTIMIFLYTTLMKKLFPLRRLDRQVRAFADGNLDIKIENYGNDEIGKIAKSFAYAIEAIKQHINSKNLFMRNMMHELKTPLTKGRIVVETLEEDEERKILIRAFDRMNEIITELAQVEKITSNNIKHHIETVHFSTIVNKAKSLLLDQNDNIIETFEDFTLQADISLFTIALKNLLDNGIKFSPNHQVEIKANTQEIEIISQGKALAYPLEYYIEPFSQGEKKEHGFGLGLYIVKAIMDIHHYKILYTYEKKNNIFHLSLNK